MNPSTFGTHHALITQPVSAAISHINDRCLASFGRKSITRYGFLSVLQRIEADTIYTKLYYYPEKIRDSKREIEDFAATFFYGEMEDLDYRYCNIIRIPIDTALQEDAINACQHMQELEQLIWNTLTEDSYVSVNPDGKEGGLTVTRFTKTDYQLWKKLLEEGYLEPAYEEQCKKELEQNRPVIQHASIKPATIPGNVKTINVQFFVKNGGDQPVTLDPDAVNHFFKKNYAKIWAMQDGFIANFTKYEDGKIHFDIISDPRFTGDEHMLSSFIAREYRNKVALLKDATSYEARHYLAKDIIGFLLNGAETALLAAYNERVQQSYAGLKKEPDFLHFGIIR